MAHIGRTARLFGRLARSAMKPSDLASASGLYLPAVEVWCSAATAYGFIEKKAGGKLSLPKRMKHILVDKTHPDYLGGQFTYLALRSLEYGAFEDLFKYGKTRQPSSAFEAIEEATHWDHYAFIRAIRTSGRLHMILTRGCSFADIGCGTGSLITKLCASYPKSRYYGIDPSDKAVALAREALKDKPATIVKLKGERLRFTEEFDIVYLGESLYAAEDKSVFVANCYRSLKKGGTLLILEGLLTEGNLAKDDLLIKGMQIDFALHGHRFMTRHELEMILQDTGFMDVRFNPLGGSVYLASARK